MTASADDAWNALADGLRDAGRKLAEATAHLDAPERTDGFRALLRALNNQLGRLETDTERPEFVPFNGWREKFFMDNPDCRYWITDIRDDRRYLITGNVGDSAFQSVTVYSGTGVADAAAVARVDTDDLSNRLCVATIERGGTVRSVVRHEGHLEQVFLRYAAERDDRVGTGRDA